MYLSSLPSGNQALKYMSLSPLFPSPSLSLQTNIGMVAQAFNSSIWEAETGTSLISLWFEASLVYIVPRQPELHRLTVLNKKSRQPPPYPLKLESEEEDKLNWKGANVEKGCTWRLERWRSSSGSCYSCRWPGFSSQHQYGGSQLCYDLTPAFSDLWVQGTHVIYIHAGKTLTYKIKC